MIGVWSIGGEQAGNHAGDGLADGPVTVSPAVRWRVRRKSCNSFAAGPVAAF